MNTAAETRPVLTARRVMLEAIAILHSIAADHTNPIETRRRAATDLIRFILRKCAPGSSPGSSPGRTSRPRRHNNSAAHDSTHNNAHDHSHDSAHDPDAHNSTHDPAHEDTPDPTQSSFHLPDLAAFSLDEELPPPTPPAETSLDRLARAHAETARLEREEREREFESFIGHRRTPPPESHPEPAPGINRATGITSTTARPNDTG